MGDNKVRVYPHPRLADTNEYLPGIGADGAEVSEAEANRLEKNDLIVRSDPRAKKAAKSPEPPPERPAPTKPEVN